MIPIIAKSVPVNVIRSGVNATQSFILIYFPKEKQLSAHNEQLKVQELKARVRIKLSSPKHHPLFKPTFSSIQTLLSAAAELAVASYSCFSADYFATDFLVSPHSTKRVLIGWTTQRPATHFRLELCKRKEKKICCSQKKNVFMAG